MPTGVDPPSPRRLLRTPAPRPGESFPGYLLRLTEENSYDSLRWIPEQTGLTVDPTRGQWADLWTPGPHITLLCEMTGLSQVELASLQEPLAPDCLVRWKAPKVCPSCLREESWYRKAWDVLPFTVCPLHRIVLVDSCPHCEHPISWARASMSVCRCGYDWRRIHSRLIGEDGSLAAARRLLSIWQERAVDDHSITEAAAQPHTLECAAVYLTALSALMDGWLQMRNGVKLQAVTGNDLCHQAAASVAHALTNWPESFFRFFDQFNETTVCDWQRAWFSHRDSDLSEMEGWVLVAGVLEEYLEMRWAGRGGPPVPRRFLRKEDASRYLNRGTNFIDQLVAQGRLRSVDGIATNGSRIDLRSLRKLGQEIEALMPAAEAAAELGIGLGQFRELVRYKLLAPDNELQMDGSGEAKFSHQALSRFLGRIADLTSQPREISQYWALSLCQVAAHLERRDLSFGQFIEAMLEDFPSAIFESEGPRNSLSRFWIYAPDFHQYLNSRSKPDKNKPDRKPLAPLCTVPSLRGVVEWLERKEEEGGDRFYRDTRQPPLDAVSVLECFVEILCRLSAENEEPWMEREIPHRKWRWKTDQETARLWSKT
jgi:hypothetical protein